jgi:hypothetical protein
VAANDCLGNDKQEADVIVTGAHLRNRSPFDLLKQHVLHLDLNRISQGACPSGHRHEDASEHEPPVPDRQLPDRQERILPGAGGGDCPYFTAPLDSPLT